MSPGWRNLGAIVLTAGLALAAPVGVLGGQQDGTWSDLAPPERAGQAAIYDPSRDQMVIFGGSHSGAAVSLRADTWILGFAPEPVWTRLDASGPPAGAINLSAIVDPVRDRMIVLLGGGHFGVWALSLATHVWQELAPSGTPPISGDGSSTVYDPVGDRVLVFGGDEICPHGPCPHNDVWELSLSGSPAWSLLTPLGTPPAARFDQTAIYDPVRDRMIVFAGAGAYGVPLDDAWALDLGSGPTWIQLTPSGAAPPGRGGYLSAYDPVADRMLVSAAARGSENDLWALSLEGSPAWAKLVLSGTPPRDRSDPSMVYDAARGRLVFHGGAVSSGGQTDGETWAVSLGGSPTWSAVIAPPTGRDDMSAVLDAAGDRMVVYGGTSEQTFAPFHDVWARDLGGSGTWTPLALSGPQPPARWDHTAVVDSRRNRMIVFGGYGTSTVLNDTWALSLDSSPAWSALSPAGAPPAARSGQVAVYDSVGDRMVVFGGMGMGTPTQPQFFGDTWALSFSGTPSWIHLQPAGIPPGARALMSAAFDSKRRRMIVYGGGTASGTTDETWVLDLAGAPTWLPLAVSGAPPARLWHSAVYDPIGDRMLVFGGFASSGDEQNATWALSLSGTPTWTRLAPDGGPPRQRGAHAAVFDASRNRMLVFGGYTPGQGASTVDYADTWALAWEPEIPTAVRPPAAAGAAFALRGTRPNPATRRLSVTFSLAERGPVVLEVLDLAGRRLATHDMGDLEPGPHVVKLSREVATLAPGVYVVRLRQGARSAAAKICVVR